MYDDLLYYLARHRLSLGCELVTRCLGEHGAHPRTDHLVLNAVLDRDGLSASSPLLLLEFRARYRLQVHNLPVASTTGLPPLSVSPLARYSLAQHATH